MMRVYRFWFSKHRGKPRFSVFTSGESWFNNTSSVCLCFTTKVNSWI